MSLGLQPPSRNACSPVWEQREVARCPAIVLYMLTLITGSRHREALPKAFRAVLCKVSKHRTESCVGSCYFLVTSIVYVTSAVRPTCRTVSDGPMRTVHVVLGGLLIVLTSLTLLCTINTQRTVVQRPRLRVTGGERGASSGPIQTSPAQRSHPQAPSLVTSPTDDSPPPASWPQPATTPPDDHHKGAGARGQETDVNGAGTQAAVPAHEPPAAPKATTQTPEPVDARVPEPQTVPYASSNDKLRSDDPVAAPDTDTGGDTSPLPEPAQTAAVTVPAAAPDWNAMAPIAAFKARVCERFRSSEYPFSHVAAGGLTDEYFEQVLADASLFEIKRKLTDPAKLSFNMVLRHEDSEGRATPVHVYWKHGDCALCCLPLFSRCVCPGC